MYFRGLTLFFWSIIIYKLIFLKNIYIERNAFLGLTILAILYITLIGILQIKNKFLDNIVIYYKIATLISYILTLASLMLYPTNITLMMFKLASIFIYLYISCKNAITYKIEECVVGIISSILLLALSICY